jgi:hypothetical protein
VPAIRRLGWSVPTCVGTSRGLPEPASQSIENKARLFPL